MISILDSLIYSVIGMAIVFTVLFVLIVFIKIMSSVITAVSNKTSSNITEEKPEAALARGSCGNVNTFDVPDRTAALLMAIVADKTGKPLNALRFISIKEITEKETKQ